ncbi:MULTISPECIES: type VI secretion system protein TssA [Enterobacter]|uniref:type VI secretion system protein TssA n=1 Tax=Enterobacter TaxID=547 RepID=UPI000B25CC10|nr:MULTISPECIES: type VI secretion system protein TssA [Enterobacter]EKS6337843.1 type VI secretion system protein TssA [Enterobacter hormaechei]VAL43551.1 ImpA family type VI secretion-associated protein [Enterobacter kobei]
MNLIDFDKILQPISAELPCGIPAENFPLYEAINQHRKSDTDGTDDKQGWSYQPRQSDWPKVKELCEEMLVTKSKDLQILYWLVQALIELEGIAGATEGILLISQFFSQYWETLHPAEDSDFAFRESYLNGLDRYFSRYLLLLTLDDDNTISLFNWKRVQIFEQRVAGVANSRERLIKEGYISLQDWQKKVTVTARSHILIVRDACASAGQAITVLESCLCQQIGESWQGFLETKKKLRELLEFISRFYPEHHYAAEQNDVHEQGADTILTLTEQMLPATDLPGMQPPCFAEEVEKAVPYSEQRAQALRQLNMIIALFRENEPGSPIPYLLERAISWSSMNAIEWMADIFGEETSHYMDGVNTLFGPKYIRNIQISSGTENQQHENYQMQHNQTYHNQMISGEFTGL